MFDGAAGMTSSHIYLSGSTETAILKPNATSASKLGGEAAMAMCAMDTPALV